jgi:hypothetical protein
MINLFDLTEETEKLTTGLSMKKLVWIHTCVKNQYFKRVSVMSFVFCLLLLEICRPMRRALRRIALSRGEHGSGDTVSDMVERLILVCSVLAVVLPGLLVSISREHRAGEMKVTLGINTTRSTLVAESTRNRSCPLSSCPFIVI